eukprot:gb/GEZN01006300.1/.p1 GENE.gb/GEZN01006300.1/~~gb/GEZN01006300.1/.p1  ORF type:complete len:499 (-),score=52.85 gb/GEZN01006300.1/:188-1486(-)
MPQIFSDASSVMEMTRSSSGKHSSTASEREVDDGASVDGMGDGTEGDGYKDEDRKIKHRLIDRARRRREKSSIEELKGLVTLEPRERPDKATVVASAVRTIRDLNQRVAMLERRIRASAAGQSSQSSGSSSGKNESSGASQRASGSNGSSPESDGSREDRDRDSPSDTPRSASPDDNDFADNDQDNSPPRHQSRPTSCRQSKNSNNVATQALGAMTRHASPFSTVTLNNMLLGLASAGVASMIVDITNSRITSVCARFQSVAGLQASELINHRFSESPLFGQHLSGSPDSEEPSQEQVAQGIKILVNGGSFKMLTRHASGRTGVAVEAVTTMFLLRDERTCPYAVLSISTPDSRRAVHYPMQFQERVQSDFFVKLSAELAALTALPPSLPPISILSSASSSSQTSDNSTPSPPNSSPISPDPPSNDSLDWVE